MLRTDLDSELEIEVAEAEHLRPEALVAGERVDSDVGTHFVELSAEHRVLADLGSVARRRLKIYVVCIYVFKNSVCASVRGASCSFP